MTNKRVEPFTPFSLPGRGQLGQANSKPFFALWSKRKWPGWDRMMRACCRVGWTRGVSSDSRNFRPNHSLHKTRSPFARLALGCRPSRAAPYDHREQDHQSSACCSCPVFVLLGVYYGQSVVDGTPDERLPLRGDPGLPRGLGQRRGRRLHRPPLQPAQQTRRDPRPPSPTRDCSSRVCSP